MWLRQYNSLDFGNLFIEECFDHLIIAILVLRRKYLTQEWHGVFVMGEIDDMGVSVLKIKRKDCATNRSIE